MSKFALSRWVPKGMVPFTKAKQPLPPSASPDPRAPCVVVVDDSASMEGGKIEQLNAGVAEFAAFIRTDPLCAANVEVALVTFGGAVQVESPFVPAASFDPRPRSAGGDTPLGRAVITGLELLSERLKLYRDLALDHHKPMLLVLSDGEETRSPDEFRRAGELTRRLQQQGALRAYIVGVEGADMAQLATLTAGEPYRLRTLKIPDLFRWLARSLYYASRSQVDDFEPVDPRESGIAE
jgi:uncharacterized protein YegL